MQNTLPNKPPVLNNSSVTTSTRSLITIQRLSLKSLIMASGLGVVMLSGCQTTTGLDPAASTNASTQVTRPGTPDFGHSAPYEEQTTAVQNQQPDLQDSQPSRTDNPFESNDTGEFSPVFTQQPNQGSQSSTTNQNNVTYPTPTETLPSTQPSTELPSNSQAPSISLPSTSTNDAKSAKQILIEQARQNSKRTTTSASTVEDGDNLPAFRSLMSKGEAQLRQGQVSAAQSTFTRAQRLAPQSSAVYFYLGQVALKQNQPLKAEAMARRGLVVAKTASRKRALWQVVLKAGQAQGNQRVINEARTALSR